MTKEDYHMVVDAVAGSGKTFTMLQGCLRLPKTMNIFFVAFNKHIATEAQGKLHASGLTNVTACTYHSLGYRMIREEYKGVKLNDDKVYDILDTFPSCVPNEREWRSIKTLTNKLVRLSKSYLLEPDDPKFPEEIARIADHHAIEMNGNAKYALELIPQVLELCKKKAPAEIDYQDMIWLPLVMDLPMYDMVDIIITDEAQDLGIDQQDLSFKACINGRMIFVGDSRQAIYGFRGADAASMSNMSARLEKTREGVEIFPLTITRRCPQTHVAMAQAIVPQIRALDDAPEGEVVTMNKDKAVAAMRPGDMAICRINAPLIETAYALIRRGLKPLIKGRDLGKGLIDLIDKLAKDLPEDDMGVLLAELANYRHDQEMRLLPLGDRAEGRLASLHDKCDCLAEFIHNAKTIDELKDTIERIFADFDQEGKPKNAVVLGSIHRTKGLESERVFILEPKLLGASFSKKPKPWEVEQERNATYISVTRAKFNKKTGAPGTLIFAGPIPSILAGAK